MLLEFLFSSRLHWPWSVYFVLQAASVLLMGELRPFLDVIASLYLPLIVQAFYTFPGRRAYAWAAVFSLLLAAALTRGLGWVEGLAQAMAVIAEGVILTTFAMLVVRSHQDRERSQALVLELQETQRRLEEHAAQAGQLAAERERNQLARELHDSVGQMMFSIELTCESARLLLERDPAQVPAMLDRLQEMTGEALGHLRSIISELRPNTIARG
jgi:signal transduction histidine kinase